MPNSSEQFNAERAHVITEESRKAKAALELEHKSRKLAELHDVLKERDAVRITNRAGNERHCLHIANPL